MKPKSVSLIFVVSKLASLIYRGSLLHPIRHCGVLPRDIGNKSAALYGIMYGQHFESAMSRDTLQLFIWMIHITTVINSINHFIWWRIPMETFSAQRTLSEGNPRGTGRFPSQRPVTRTSDVLLDVPQNKRLNKQWSCRWYETPWCPWVIDFDVITFHPEITFIDIIFITLFTDIDKIMVNCFYEIRSIGRRYKWFWYYQIWSSVI